MFCQPHNHSPLTLTPTRKTTPIDSSLLRFFFPCRQEAYFIPGNIFDIDSWFSWTQIQQEMKKPSEVPVEWHLIWGYGSRVPSSLEWVFHHSQGCCPHLQNSTQSVIYSHKNIAVILQTSTHGRGTILRRHKH